MWEGLTIESGGVGSGRVTGREKVAVEAQNRGPLAVWKAFSPAFLRSASQVCGTLATRKVAFPGYAAIFECKETDPGARSS